MDNYTGDRIWYFIFTGIVLAFLAGIAYSIGEVLDLLREIITLLN